MDFLNKLADMLPDFLKPFGDEYLRGYANFTGRTDVKNFWSCFIINFIISLLLGVLCRQFIIGFAFKTIYSLWSLVIICPSIAIAIRRLRDSGKEWFYLFFGLIPLVGWIILIVFFCSPSVDSHSNNKDTIDSEAHEV